MSDTWHSLYLPLTDAAPVAETLRSLLKDEGYRAYDPFPGGMGTPPGLREMVRVFVAPPQDGWVRVLGDVPANVIEALGAQLGVPVLHGWLTPEDGGFALVHNGVRHTEPEAIAGALVPDQSPDQLRRAFAGEIDVPVIDSDQPPVVALGMDALPPELQALAQQKDVNPDKAAKMFEKMSGNLFRKIGGGGGDSDEQAQARAMMMGQQQNVWNSLAGQRVRAAANVLDLPDNWRTPTLEAVREAYQVHRLRERNPRLTLMPGDKEAMQAIPDALDYIPVYFGRR
ncbi:MAG TPA: hypothetical protein PKD09_23090 [Aggregatilinea sp.]|uniref:hypothetical protein n=1 Tax=Aggregatilinea sp. TaxID=2806333 RepID=UPI002C78F1D5|nr:hypothetical protein [Aggregatilinea sp.]HML24557.1 hypothetical protein [Aggregatilinea sp.]